MTTIKTCIVIALLCNCTSVRSQSPFWSDTFEDTGAPTSGTRTASLDKGGSSVPYAYYFLRTDGSNIALNPPSNGDATSYQNVEGNKFWAGEDLDRVRTGVNNADDKEQNITWTGINISGKSNMVFKGLFAAYNIAWQNINQGPNYDYLIVEYNIDGAGWIPAGAFQSDGSDGLGSGKLRFDADGDGIGDADGLLLSRTFQEVSWSITGTGNTMALRFRARADASLTQEFAIDNFRLFENAGLPVTFAGVNAQVKEGKLTVNWQTLSETNNDHFEVQVSKDGKKFTTISTVKSKATEDASLSAYDYSVPIDITGIAGVLGISTLSLLFLTLPHKRRKVTGFMVLVALGVAFYSCSKSGSDGVDTGSHKISLRIAQVDKDGTKTYSKVIIVSHDN